MKGRASSVVFVLPLIAASSIGEEAPLQERARELPPATPAAVPFPAVTAVHVVRGTVRLQTGQEARQRAARQGAVVEELGLTLPGVVVFVRGLEERWTFREPAARSRVRLVLDPFAPLPPGIVPFWRGQEIAIENKWPVEGSVRGIGGIGPSMSWRQHLTVVSEAPQTSPGVQMTITLGNTGSIRVSGPAAAWSVGVSTISFELRVMQHPIFALSDAGGRFALPPLPPGDYDVMAVHATLGEARARVTLPYHARPTPVVLTLPAR